MTNTSLTMPAIAQVREHWGWFLALGIVFIVGGIFAIAPVVASVAVAIAIGARSSSSAPSRSFRRGACAPGAASSGR